MDPGQEQWNRNRKGAANQIYEVCSCDLQVLAVVNKRLAKALLKEQPDIETFARRLDVTRDRIATWPSDSLVVFAEHPSLFYDLMTDQLLDQVRAQLNRAQGTLTMFAEHPTEGAHDSAAARPRSAYNLQLGG